MSGLFPNTTIILKNCNLFIYGTGIACPKKVRLLFRVHKYVMLWKADFLQASLSLGELQHDSDAMGKSI